MNPDQRSSSGRKVKFTPKPPPNRKPKPAATKTEANDERNEDSAQTQALLRRWNEDITRHAPKEERKFNVEVAFGPGGSSPSPRTDGIGKGVDSDAHSGSASKYFANKRIGLRRSSAATTEDQTDTRMIDVPNDTTNASAQKVKREYREPWDYEHSYYPTTLPLRKPYSGNPEMLDEEEFGEAATSREYDENTVNPAAELGLLEKSEQPRMLFFKLPNLPLVKQPVSRKGKEKIGTSAVSGGPTKSKEELSALEELSKGGYMGKMVVYKSGAIKLKLGETLFDVSPGSNCIFAQDIVAINTAQKHCCDLGEVNKRVVVTPDLDSVEL